MFPRKSSVATVDYPIHNLVLPQSFPVTRRHSAAPFSLTRAPTTDIKYSTLGTSHRSKTSSSQEPHPIKLEDTGYERTFFARMGRKLSAFLPKGVPAEHQESPVLRIKMSKEVHVATEEAARHVRMGSSGDEGPLLHKPSYLWRSPSEEKIHASYIHDSGVSLRPATAPGGSAGRHSRRKPLPLSPGDVGYHTTTRIEQSYPKYSEQPGFQTMPPTQPYSVPDGPGFPKSSQPNSGVYLRPTTAPGGSAERQSRRKPVPLSPMDINYRMTTGIKQLRPSCSEEPQFQTLPPTRPYSEVPVAPTLPKRSQPNLGYGNTPTNVVCAINRTSSPVPPPVPPKLTRYMPHSQASPSPNTISTVGAPIRPAQMWSLWTTWKSLFGGRAGKGRMSYSKKRVILFARKASLKRKKGKTTHSPYQPYSHSTRTVSVHTPRDSRRESTVVSRRFSVKYSRKLSSKQKSGLTSFLSIDSSDSLT